MNLKDLPTTAAIICSEYEGWIVGSAACPTAIRKELNDIDIVVPFHQWRRVSKIVAAKRMCSLNKHGGSRFRERGIEIDVWPDTLRDNMLTCISQWMWQPRFDIRFQRVT